MVGEMFCGFEEQALEAAATVVDENGILAGRHGAQKRMTTQFLSSETAERGAKWVTNSYV